MGDSALSVALRAHVTENEPPLGLDAAGILAGGRRSVLRRRLIGGVAFALTAALAVAATTVGLPDPDGSARVAAGEFTTVQVGKVPLGFTTATIEKADSAKICKEAAVGRPAAEGGQRYTSNVLGWIGVKLGCHLTRELPRTYPQWDFGFGGPVVTLPQENPRSQPTVWMSLSVSADSSGRVHEAAEILVSLAYSGERQAAVDRCAAAVGTAKPCEQRTGQDGETILAFTGPTPGDASVEVYAGSTKVLVEQLPVYQSPGARVPTVETPFFTKDRMVWLAALPALRLFP